MPSCDCHVTVIRLSCDHITAVCNTGSKMVNEFSCVCLHGDRRPQERKENLLSFKVKVHPQGYLPHSCEL